jgi:chromosomal replication initiation ATPase DnaA
MLRPTLANFVVCDFNRRAYEAAEHFVTNTNHKHRPLVITGATGNGKTHLCWAVRNALRFGVGEDRRRFPSTSGYALRNIYLRDENWGQLQRFRDRLLAVEGIYIEHVNVLDEYPKACAEVVSILEGQCKRGKPVLLDLIDIGRVLPTGPLGSLLDNAGTAFIDRPSVPELYRVLRHLISGYIGWVQNRNKLIQGAAEQANGSIRHGLGTLLRAAHGTEPGS